ncbi:MAG: ParB/RepB/Spo0J family partition protein [Cyanobacteria bacterium P01_E01_bin.6]
MTRKRRSEPYQIKGVDALFGEPTTAPTDVNYEPIQSPLQKENGITLTLQEICLPEKQPRRYFDPVKLEQLTESVKQHGILEPILVRPVGDKYELVAGERRYRAATAAGLEIIPAVVREFNDFEALEVSLLENLQREDLNPVEETEGILELLSMTLQITKAEVISLLNRAANARKREQDLTDNVIRQMGEVEKIFRMLGRSSPESFRANRLPLLNLPEDVLGSLQRGEIEYTKARAIGKLKNRGDRKKLLSETIEGNLSLSDIRTQIKKTSHLSEKRLHLESRLKTVSRKMKASDLLNDAQKIKQVEELLNRIEDLLNS